MTPIDEWFRRKTAARCVGIREAREVSYTHDRHLGPRWEFAGITLRVEPAETFSFESGAVWPEGFRSEDYVPLILDGVLDELLARDGTLKAWSAPCRPVNAFTLPAYADDGCHSRSRTPE
jgi:hypothetical protein